MASDLKDYKVTFEDGTERIFQLDADDLKVYEDAAKNKDSDVKSVSAGTSTPANKGS